MRINSEVEMNLLTEKMSEAFEPAFYTSTSVNTFKGFLKVWHYTGYGDMKSEAT